MIGDDLVAPVEVDYFVDGAAEVREIFDVGTVQEHGAFAPDASLEHHVVGVEGLSDFHNETLLLVAEKDEFVVAGQSLQEYGKSGTLHHLEARSELVLSVHQCSRQVEYEHLVGHVAWGKGWSRHQQLIDCRPCHEARQVVEHVLGSRGVFKQHLIDKHFL